MARVVVGLMTNTLNDRLSALEIIQNKGNDIRIVNSFRLQRNGCK